MYKINSNKNTNNMVSLIICLFNYIKCKHENLDLHYILDELLFTHSKTFTINIFITYLYQYLHTKSLKYKHTHIRANIILPFTHILILILLPYQSLHQLSYTS